MTDESLEETISQWVTKTGYALEMRVASELVAREFKVIQSEYYPDPKTGDSREVDIVCYESKSGSGCQFLAPLVFECKRTVDTPWVLFTHKRNLVNHIRIEQCACSQHAEGVRNRLAADQSIRALSLLSIPERTGYTLVAPNFKNPSGKSKDRPYEALMGVSSACLGVISTITDPADRTSHRHVFPFPFVILEGRLFEVFLSEDGDTNIGEISSGLIAWRNPVLGFHSFIQIYTESGLRNDLNRIRSDVAAFVDSGIVIAEQLKSGNQGLEIM